MHNTGINTNNRVILITGDSTKWFEQAIFVVRKNTAQKDIPVDFIHEAERIIENYMDGGTEFMRKAKNQSKIEIAAATDDAGSYVPSSQSYRKKPAQTGKNSNSSITALSIAMILCCIVLAVALGRFF